MITFWVAATVVILLDRLTKWFAARRLPRSRIAGVRIRILRSKRLHGLQRHLGPRGLSITWALLVVAIVLLTRETSLFAHHLARVGLGVALGGATSNLYDRLRHGAIIDFLDVGWWPVFNFADVAITAGAVLALWFGIPH